MASTMTRQRTDVTATKLTTKPRRLFRRTIEANRPTTLYHFTSRLHWRFIEAEGINRGEIPLNRFTLGNAPNLTTDPRPDVQRWCGDVGEVLGHSPGGLPIINGVDKRAVRITVQVPPEDDRLISWVELVRRFKMDARCFRHLNRTGGGGASQWWIYRGTVSPCMFTQVEFLDGGETHEVERTQMEVVSKARSSDEARSLLHQSRLAS
jgi:hypothetical protein